MRTTLALAAVLALTLSTGVIAAATPHMVSLDPPRCHDAKGRFMKCPMVSTGSASAVVHAKCKDGFAWSGKQRSGACAKHKGVATWG